MKEERMKEEKNVLSGETKIFSKRPSKAFGAFVKNSTEGVRYFNAAANERIGSNVYDHLRGSGHSH